MEEKTYKLSLQQLNDLVSDAEKKEAVEVTQMDDEQYREAMDTMAKNRGARRPS